MFSGIVEETAQVVAIEHDKDNIHITMKCSFVDELKNRSECGPQWRLPDCGSQR